LKKALAKKPSQRFQTANEFKTALDQCLTKPRGQRLQRQLSYVAGALLLAGAIAGGGYWFVQWSTSVSANTPIGMSNVSAPRRLLSQEDQKKVERLLQVAKAHFMVGRLVSPQGSNAFEAYQQVLAIDPGNQDALAGIQEVTDRFYKRASLLWSQGDVQNTKEHLALAAVLLPNHQGFAALRKEVEASGK
ncbi:MAG TPA: hypothetical protein VFM46_12650, partial [Pseudomonadales bacterium]|nr:hypothetical protein [Pseudomonadales bacterium]